MHKSKAWGKVGSGKSHQSTYVEKGGLPQGA